MRVALLIGRFFPSRGGAENSALLLAEALRARHGVDLTVFTRRALSEAKRDSVSGMQVFRSGAVGGNRWIASSRYLATTLTRLTLAQPRFDVLHSVQAYSPATLGVLTKRIRGGKSLVKITASGQLGEMSELQRLPFRKVRRRLLTSVDRFVAMTDEIRDELVNAGFPSEKIVRIPNGVRIPELDPMLRAQVRESNGFRSDDFIGIFTGRLSSEKGLNILIDAWRKVAKQSTRAKLMIVGSGGTVRNVEGALRQAVVSASLQDSIRFMGEVVDPIPLLLSADLFVLPSRSEGMSNALLEAMAAGLPTVVTRIRANAEVARKDVDALHVAVDEPDELAAAILTLLASTELRERLGSAARRRASEMFSVERVASQYFDLYSDLLRERS